VTVVEVKEGGIEVVRILNAVGDWRSKRLDTTD